MQYVRMLEGQNNFRIVFSALTTVYYRVEDIELVFFLQRSIYLHFQTFKTF